MAFRRRAGLLVAATLVLSACATAPEQRPEPGPVVRPPATSPPGAPKGCAPGDGRVVRLTDKTTADTMNGGVLGGVLADNANGSGGQAHAPGAAGGHDIYVQMDDGRKLIVNQRDLGGIAVGVKVSIDAACRARPSH